MTATVWINGYGFPSHRGGPMFYADTVGLSKILETIRRFREKHGLARPSCYAAERRARGRWPDERVWIAREFLHPRLVTENGTARAARRRIDREDGNAPSLGRQELSDRKSVV